MKEEENNPPNRYTNSAAVRKATWQRLIPGLRKALPDCTAPNSDPKSIIKFLSGDSCYQEVIYTRDLTA